MVQDDIEDHRVRPGVGRGSLISRTEARGGATAIQVQDVDVMAGTGVVVKENILGGRGEILQGDLTVELPLTLNAVSETTDDLFVKRAGEAEEEVWSLPAEVCKPVLFS